MTRHRFNGTPEIAERVSRHGRALEEILARRAAIKRRMDAVRASARQHRESHHIRERNEAIALAQRANRAVAKASEAHLPADERRQIIDLSELRAVAHECAVVFPFAALGTVAWFAANIP